MTIHYNPLTLLWQIQLIEFQLGHILLCVSVGCTLVECNLKEIHVFSGQSVLLPCSCTDLLVKPQSLTWNFQKQNSECWIPLTQSDLYRYSVDMLNIVGTSLSTSHTSLRRIMGCKGVQSRIEKTGTHTVHQTLCKR